MIAKLGRRLNISAIPSDPNTNTAIDNFLKNKRVKNNAIGIKKMKVRVPVKKIAEKMIVSPMSRVLIETYCLLRNARSKKQTVKKHAILTADSIVPQRRKELEVQSSK